MAFDKTNTITINSIAADKRTERGPIMRGQLFVTRESLRKLLELDGWDGVTPLKLSFWVREGEDRNGETYRFWSGPVEVDEWLQDKNAEREQERRPAKPAPRSRPIEDDDIPF